jgi:hypothetical protein
MIHYLKCINQASAVLLSLQVFFLFSLSDENAFSSLLILQIHSDLQWEQNPSFIITQLSLP